jgi:hypothetical protein
MRRSFREGIAGSYSRLPTRDRLVNGALILALGGLTMRDLKTYFSPGQGNGLNCE